MRKKTYLVLHKSEWDKLHRRKDESHRSADEREEYFRKLNEKSQRWIKTWPDTTLGHVQKVAQQKEKRHAEQLAIVKSGQKVKKQEITREAIKKAKQQIFDDSCYGKQLLSALMESKTLEERNTQLEFQKFITKQIQEHESEIQTKFKLDQCSFNLDKREQEEIQLKRELETELADINKSLHEMEINKRLKQRKEQKELDLENTKLTQELLQKEALQEKAYEDLLRQGAERYDLEQKIAKDRKIEQEKKVEAIANAQRVEQERKYCKIKKVMKQIHGDRHNTEQFKRSFESIEGMQRREKRRYDEFVQKGMKQLEKRLATKDQEEHAKQKLERERRQELAKANRLAAEETEQMRQVKKHYNKCVGYRQTILPKSRHHLNIKPTLKSTEKEPPSFLSSTKLSEQLKERSVAPSPWNGLDAAHAHFAQAAGEILQECRYKHFARKVVDEYRKVNCLDSTSLPVPNY